MKRKKVVCVVSWRKPEVPLRLILLLQTTAEREAFWQPVVGSVDEGEDFAGAALREAEEETGLTFSTPARPLGLHYEAQDRRGNLTYEECFHLALVTDHLPTPHLDGKEHQAYGWFPVEEALTKVRFPQNAKAIELAAQPPLLLTKRGVFFHEGEEVTHERTKQLFHRSLVKAGQQLWVKAGQESMEVIAHDVYRFVESYDAATGELRFLDGLVEKLRPETLYQRSDHSFLCQRSDGEMAVFLSPAHYAFAQTVREESGKYCFDFLGKLYPLTIPL
jgi:8-oxo-dGTP pyrophosphatase MutT (NUDIX family)